MEYEDLFNWLEKRRKPDAPQPVIVNIDLGDLLSRLMTDRDEVKVRDRIAPYPS